MGESLPSSLMMTLALIDQTVRALVEVINAPTRPPALQPLAYIKYPPKELRPQVNPDGLTVIAVQDHGKHIILTVQGGKAP